MFIKVSNSRQEQWVSQDCDFQDFVAFDYDNQHFYGELEFYSDKKNDDDLLEPEIDELMATVRVAIFEGQVYDKYDVEKKALIADGYSGDEYDAIEALCHVAHEYSDDELNPMFCTVYIDRLYVEEKFRKTGLATWILSNFPSLLNYYFRVDPQFITIIPSPFGYSNLEEQNETDKKEIIKMQKIMVQILKKNGFKKVRNENVYFKDFPGKEY